MKLVDSMVSAPAFMNLRKAGEAKDDDSILKSFDAYFMSEMLKQSQGDEEDQLLSGGGAERTYREFFYDEIARMLSERGGLGFSRQLSGELGSKQSSEQDEVKP